MPARISIVLPGLFDLPLADLDEGVVRESPVRLNRLLALAQPLPNRAFDLDTMLAQALGLEADSAGARVSLPLAQAQFGADRAGAGQGLLFEAVHLRPDLRSAVLVPIEKNARNLEDLGVMVNDMGELFAADFDISPLSDGRYLMRLGTLAAPCHYPHLLSVLGKSASPYVEQARANLPWYRLLNEMQMFLHQHPRNQLRIDQDLLPINSLWFWGGGPPPRRTGPAPAWYGGDAELGRFAASLGLEPRPLDEFAPAAGEDAIVVDLRLLEALKSARGHALDALLLDLDERVFAVALAAVARCGHRLRLRAGFEVDFEMGPYSRLRFWRRPRSLLDWRVPAEA